MQRWGFGARGRSWHLGVGAFVAFVLAGTLAVLAVRADAGTSTPRLASVQRAAAAPVGAHALGAPAASTGQAGYVVLKPRDEQSLKSFIASVTKLHSSQYHQYLKAGQFAAKFGPSSSTISAVKAQLSKDGLTVTSVARDGLLIGFSGTTTNVESAFRTSLERYKSAAGITGEQTTKAVSLPSNISGDVAAVIGLNTLVHPEADLVRAPKSAFAGRRAAKTSNFTHYTAAPAACSDASGTAAEFGGLTDDQIANAYGATPLYGAGDTGAGVSIGVYELEPFSESDLATFDNCYFPSAEITSGPNQGDNTLARSVSTVNVDGGQPTGSGSGESILDIEDVSAMAPGARIDVYEAPNTSAGSLDEYAQMVDDDTDQVITSSWGLCEQDLQLADPGAQQAENYIFEQAAAQGQTVLSAAGDTGDDTCNEVRSIPPPSDQNPLSVEDPASQPYVLAVGGTTIQDADPSHYDETVWNDGAEWGGGGGGISESWMAPSWQLLAPVPTGEEFPGSPTSNDFTTASTFESTQTVSSQNATPGFCTSSSAYPTGSGAACRTLPDVSAQADEFTGAVTIYQAAGGGWFTIGGTSSATPIWAAMLALVDASSYCSGDTIDFSGGSAPDIGFANPLLYAVAKTPGEYADSFHDITVGNNDVYGFDNGASFPATTDYDLASGLGSPILADNSDGTGLAEYLCELATANHATAVVTGVSPDSGLLTGGNIVVVGGSGFGTTDSPNVASVTVGSDVITPSSANGSFTVENNNDLHVTMPGGSASLAPGTGTTTDPSTGVTYSTSGSEAPQDGAGPANVVVTLNSGASSIPNEASVYDDVDAEISGNPTPSVSSVSPYSGLQSGTNQITVYGSGFTANDTVTIGSRSASSVTYMSPSELKVVVPPYSSADTDCATNPQLITELANLHDPDTNPAADDICQTEVVVTDPTGGPYSSNAVTPPTAYLGPLPSSTQDGLLEVPAGDEITAAPDEYDYVPQPSIASVSTQTQNPADLANADPGSFGTPTVIKIKGAGLSYQTLNWLYFGGTSTTSSQDTSYPAYDDGTTIEIEAPTDPNGTPSGPAAVPVVADTTAAGAKSSDGSPCSTTTVDCVTYAGIPEVDSVSTGNTDTIGGNTVATASNAGGADLTINGAHLSDVAGPLEFIDNIVNPIFGAQFSVASQYSYTTTGDTAITTETVDQNPALVDTVACSVSGCSASGQTDTGQQVNPGDLILLYPPGNPVITSIQSASGPPAGGTLMTINGENLGCVTSIRFGAVVAEAIGQEQALLDCGLTSQVVVIAPPGSAGASVPIILTTVESDATHASPATSLNATSPPTEFTYDTVNPSVPGSVAFGSVNLGQSSTETVTLSNPALATQLLYPEPGGAPDSNGNQSPLLASIGGSNAGDFTITNDGCAGQALFPEQSCSFQVEFAPRELGSRSATLDIPFNYSQSVANSFGLPSQTPDLQAALNGTGAEPTITNTVTTTKTVTKTIRKTCTITVKWRWVTVKVHGKKKREHKKFTTRSKGCKRPTRRAGKPRRKHDRRHRG
jgi:Pro-kumamolisin, activation domain/IPT/TIG domain